MPTYDDLLLHPFLKIDPSVKDYIMRLKDIARLTSDRAGCDYSRTTRSEVFGVNGKVPGIKRENLLDPKWKPPYFSHLVRQANAKDFQLKINKKGSMCFRTGRMLIGSCSTPPLAAQEMLTQWLLC